MQRSDPWAPTPGFPQGFLQGPDLCAPTPATFAGARFASLTKCLVGGLPIWVLRFLNAEVGPVGARTSDLCRDFCRSRTCARPHLPPLQARAQMWPLRVPAPDRFARRRSPRLGRLRETPGHRVAGDGARLPGGGPCAKVADAGTHPHQVCASGPGTEWCTFAKPQVRGLSGHHRSWGRVPPSAKMAAAGTPHPTARAQPRTPAKCVNKWGRGPGWAALLARA